MSGRPLRLVVVIVIAFTALAFNAAASATSPPRAGPSPGLPSAESLMARHLQALGRLPELVAKWSGSITEGGQTARYEVVSARDGRFRRTYQLSLGSRTQGSNGVVDWEQDENGNVRTTPATRHSSMDARLVRLNDMLLDSHDAVVLALTKVDGHRVYSVSMNLEGTNAIVYFDAASWLIDGADYGRSSVRYRSYRRFGGVAVPVDVTEKGPDGDVTITVGTVEFMRGDDAAFAPPPQREPIFPSGVTSVELNFDSPHGLIVCSAKINGHPVRLLVDSGSTTSIVDADLAKRLDLPQGGVATVEGAAALTGTVAKIDSLDLDGIRFEPLYVQAVPLRLPGRIAHEGIVGILGYDLFAPLVARLSYRRDKIELIQPAAFSYTGTGSVISLGADRHVPVITASVGENHAGTFTVDTGSTAALVLFRHFADRNSVDFLNPSQHDVGLRREDISDPDDFGPSTASGAGGDFPTRLGVIDRLNLGAFSLPEVVTEVVMRDAGAFGTNSATDGIVGGGALAQFSAVFFDYLNGRLILER